GLLHHGMREAPLDLDDDRLLVLVADDGALQDALWHVHRPYAFLPADFSTAMVLMRAMSLRTCLTRAVFSSWPVAFWKRRLNCSFFRPASSSLSWSRVLALTSEAFIDKPFPCYSAMHCTKRVRTESLAAPRRSA